jgi:hypothetical protein
MVARPTEAAVEIGVSRSMTSEDGERAPLDRHHAPNGGRALDQGRGLPGGRPLERRQLAEQRPIAQMLAGLRYTELVAHLDEDAPRPTAATAAGSLLKAMQALRAPAQAWCRVGTGRC